MTNPYPAVMPIAPRPSVLFTRGSGSWLIDSEGRRYLDFVQGLRRLTRDSGLLLICDEVQTGMGRTGALFAHQAYGIEADIMTLGKGIGGGVPLSALLVKAAVSCFQPGDQGGTYNGNPLVCAAGIAVLKTLLETGFLEGVNACGSRLCQGLLALSARHELGEVRGAGLLLALQTGRTDATALAARALEQGLLINAPRADTLRFMPALTVSDEETDLMLEQLDSLLARTRSP